MDPFIFYIIFYIKIKFKTILFHINYYIKFAKLICSFVHFRMFHKIIEKSLFDVLPIHCTKQRNNYL